MNIIPLIIPSTTSLDSTDRIYNIPKNPVTSIVNIGTIKLTCGKLSLNIGLNSVVAM